MYTLFENGVIVGEKSDVYISYILERKKKMVNKGNDKHDDANSQCLTLEKEMEKNKKIYIYKKKK